MESFQTQLQGLHDLEPEEQVRRVAALKTEYPHFISRY